jgi:hypothetical protein
MFKDTLQISAQLIEAALRLHALNFRHKWRIGDQFCVAQDCEIFWQMLFSDCVYFIDSEFLNLMEELARQGVGLAEETNSMVFIPRLEDVAEFCAANVFKLELNIEPDQKNPLYRARLIAQDKAVCEETTTGLRVAALRALATALETYLQPLPAGSLPTPI